MSDVVAVALLGVVSTLAASTLSYLGARRASKTEIRKIRLARRVQDQRDREAAYSELIDAVHSLGSAYPGNPGWETHMAVWRRTRARVEILGTPDVVAALGDVAHVVALRPDHDYEAWSQLLAVDARNLLDAMRLDIGGEPLDIAMDLPMPPGLRTAAEGEPHRLERARPDA